MSAEVEVPYTVSEVCKLTGLSVQTVIRVFQCERGVIVLQNETPGKRAYRSFRIPRPVFRRVVSKWTVH
jgi:hypothetical protein